MFSLQKWFSLLTCGHRRVAIPPLKRRKESKDRLARRMPMKRFRKGERDGSLHGVYVCVWRCALCGAQGERARGGRGEERKRDAARRSYRRDVRLFMCVSEGGRTRRETSLSRSTTREREWYVTVFLVSSGRWPFARAWRIIARTQLCSRERERERITRTKSILLSPTTTVSARSVCFVY